MTSICVLNDMTDADTDKQMNKIQQGSNSVDSVLIAALQVLCEEEKK